MKKSVILLLPVILAVSMVCCKSRKENQGSTPSDAIAKESPKAAVEKKTKKVPERIPKLTTTLDVTEKKRLSALKHYYKGIELRSDGKPDEALAELIAAVVDDAGNLESRYQLAVTLAQRKRGGEALAILKQFGDAGNCPGCFSFLARASRNEAFRIFGSNPAFADLVDGPAARMEKAMAAANWVGYDKDALKKQRVELTFQGLPAVSADGTRVIAASLGKDKGGRITSATLQTLDANTGERLSAKRILFRPEGERIISGKMNYREAARLLDKRIKYIHQTLVVGKWEPAKKVAVETKKKLARCEKAQQFSVLDRMLTYAGTRLTVAATEEAASVVVDGQKWLPAGDKTCITRPMIREVYADEAHQLLLLQLGFCSDACVSTTMMWTAVPL